MVASKGESVTGEKQCYTNLIYHHCSFTFHCSDCVVFEYSFNLTILLCIPCIAGQVAYVQRCTASSEVYVCTYGIFDGECHNIFLWPICSESDIINLCMPQFKIRGLQTFMYYTVLVSCYTVLTCAFCFAPITTISLLNMCIYYGKLYTSECADCSSANLAELKEMFLTAGILENEK